MLLRKGNIEIQKIVTHEQNGCRMASHCLIREVGVAN